MAKMPDLPLKAGDEIADFVLESAEGAIASSAKTRENALLLIILFRTGCGTCQYSAPYFERFHKYYALPSQGSFQVWGITQDSETATQYMAGAYGLTFPLLYDSMLEVSERYGITHVPNLFLIDSGRTIVDAVTGHFSAERYNQIARQIAQYLEVPYVPIVGVSDDAPALKPG